VAESPVMSYDVPEAEPEPDEPRRQRGTPQRSTMLDDVANDLALWIDDTANKIALAFAPGRAPFAADLTEDQKLDYYTRALFNPDGSPNVSGRNREVARLGVEGFGQVYKAVVAAHPEFKPPTDPMLEVPR
jgi:hypothetical protein